ncbi:MAG: short-chain dehydrogenase/reductase [Actinomycetia bacterium]|nr:short-chain dehydrogenase/reductase [Actinomycetes bacterium]
MIGPLDGRVAVVTGAGQGVGRGIALALAEAGASIVVAARRAETGEPVAAEVRARGAAAICVETDVADRAAVQAMVDRTVAELGRLDVMIHNAIKPPSPHRVESVGIEQWEELSTVTVWGSLYCARSAYPHLKASGHGRFIMLTSPAGIEASAGLPLYGPVKAAQRAMAKSLAREWGPDGITVNCIGPVAVTPALDKAFAENAELRGRIEARTPLRRLGDPEADIGGVAAFLASDAAGYVTGQTIICAGGSFTGL